MVNFAHVVGFEIGQGHQYITSIYLQRYPVVAVVISSGEVMVVEVVIASSVLMVVVGRGSGGAVLVVAVVGSVCAVMVVTVLISEVVVVVVTVAVIDGGVNGGVGEEEAFNPIVTRVSFNPNILPLVELS
ncbi:hypothetical protein BVC80_1065g5 [Macleaya cordata]|uniref:Uncharacterized protein n=1 Tax=Macleaya cordata TaxID=56857 RepID=A0A200RCQ6_MACCD|nr:hypothetical protein BVC80_1065g5 [Macleaya cordata]